jgi:hypothetical protein
MSDGLGLNGFGWALTDEEDAFSPETHLLYWDISSLEKVYWLAGSKYNSTGFSPLNLG